MLTQLELYSYIKIYAIVEGSSRRLTVNELKLAESLILGSLKLSMRAIAVGHFLGQTAGTVIYALATHNLVLIFSILVSLAAACNFYFNYIGAYLFIHINKNGYLN